MYKYIEIVVTKILQTLEFNEIMLGPETLKKKKIKRNNGKRFITYTCHCHAKHFYEEGFGTKPKL